MLNFLTKFLLVSTSLSPVLGAMAISQFERGCPWTTWIWWLIAAIFLVFLCRCLLKYSAVTLQDDELTITEFERKDFEILTFLFIYLLPFIRSDHVTLENQWLTAVYVVSVIIVAIVYANAFHFNPVMRLFGYRFYSVKDGKGMSNLVISKTDLQRHQTKCIPIVELATNVYLHKESEDA